jgi:hypothetical protein
MCESPSLCHRRRTTTLSRPAETQTTPRNTTPSYQKHFRPRGRLQRLVRHRPLRHSPQQPNLYPQTNTANRESDNVANIPIN